MTMSEAFISRSAVEQFNAAAEGLPFEEDAKINSVLLLQKRVFQLQAECLQNAQQRKKFESNVRSTVDAFVLPSILARRNVSDEMQAQNRVLDDVEMTLLGILDSSGMLSLCCRIPEFIVVMTRVVKVEHRALCLYILSNCMTSKCGQSFITFGGLRLLKRWIKVAEEEDCVDELRIIVTLCKLLPFDGQALKDTEIGKSIKRLLKFKSTATSIESLYSDVRNLMQHWTNHVKGVIVMKSNDANIVGANEKLPDIVTYISNRLLQERGKPQPQVAKIANSSTPVSDATITSSTLELVSTKDKNTLLLDDLKSRSTDILETSEVSMDGGISVDTLDSGNAKHTAVTPSSSFTAMRPTILPISVPSSGGFGFGSRLGGLDVRIAAPPTTITAIKRTSTDGANIMAEKAKILLQNQLKNTSSSALPSNIAGTNILDLMESSSSSAVLTNNIQGLPGVSIPVGPLKGGLKRKHVEHSSGNSIEGPLGGETVKRTRMTVQWADENGGILRDVMTFEVERIKNTIKDYKSHRDLVRKERQLEKDLHLSKSKEVMHPAVEWRKPENLILSIDIRYHLLIHLLIILSQSAVTSIVFLQFLFYFIFCFYSVRCFTYLLIITVFVSIL